MGQARFEIREKRAEISVSLAPEFRTLGLGPRLIRMASEQAIEEGKVEYVCARVKRENQASLHSFTKAGFRWGEEAQYKGFHTVSMTYPGGETP